MFQEVDPKVNLCQLVEIMCPSTIYRNLCWMNFREVCFSSCNASQDFKRSQNKSAFPQDVTE